MPVDQCTADPAADPAAELRAMHDALVREAALVHARARAAEYLVREDPVAAARALRGLTVSSAAVADALEAGAVLAPPAGPEAGAVVLSDLLGGFRATGRPVRFSASGPEQRLSPDGEAAVRSLLGDVVTLAADEAGSLSVALTWSPAHLDLLVVLGPRTGARAGSPEPGATAGLARSADAVHAAGGTLRVELPEAGGRVVAASLPVRVPARTVIGA